MGLDMYLSAKRYFSKYGTPEEEKIRQEIKKACNFKYEQPNLEFIEVEFEIFYWRKANQIHKWFVDNVQKGVDDCGYYYVEREQLQELLAFVTQVLQAEKTPEEGQVAMQVLPTQPGFFFGNTEYNEYYYDDLKMTKEGLEKILATPELKNYSFSYHSSW